jgi:hypothetical protein
MKDLFSGNKYVTHHAHDVLPVELQLLLWDLIEVARRKVQLDYLQIFHLEEVKEGNMNAGHQRIVHIQEEPSYRLKINVSINSPITGKVYVADERTHATMMMAEDY